MKTGFSFNNKHCSEFGAVMKTVSRPIHPEMKSYIFESPILDGTYDFSAANSYGRAFYKNRVFVISMLVFADNIYLLQDKLSQISLWLSGEGILVFDDMIDVEWKASVINGIDYAPENKGRQAILSVMFNVEPFSFGRFSFGEDVMLDTSIPITAATPLEWGNLSEYYVTSKDHTIPPTVEVFNIGTWYVRPKIRINVQGCRAVSISLGEKTLTYIGNLDPMENIDVVIDFEKQTATDKNGNDLSGNLVGEFFELVPGKNTLTFENHWYDIDRAYGYNIEVRYVPRYMYDLDEEVWEAMYNAQIVSA